MGFFDRVLNRTPRPDGPEHQIEPGESYRQDDLWHLVGGFSADRIRCDVTAVLVPEPENLHDPNAIKVLIDGRHVGYLSREDAVIYLPGLRRLTASHSSPIALSGQIVGGGQREDGLGMLGVFLDHDPADFGLRPRQTGHIGEMYRQAAIRCRRTARPTTQRNRPPTSTSNRAAAQEAARRGTDDGDIPRREPDNLKPRLVPQTLPKQPF